MTQARTTVAIAGAGYIASYHLDILRALPQVEITGIMDVDRGRAEQLAQRYRVPLACGSLDELLERARPSVVHVLVPPTLHARVAAQCLRAGAGVFLEKPFATTAADARALCELAREKNRPLGVNHNQVYHPRFQKLVRAIARGKFGRVQQVMSITNVPLRQLESGDFSHF